MEWAPNWPQLASPVGPTSDIACMCGLNWAWFLGCLLGIEWAPNGPQLASPVGPHVEYCVDLWGKLGLGFRAVCWVWSGPQLASPVGPTLDMVLIRGLN